MSDATHRIDLAEFDAERYPDGSVEIRERLSWKQRTDFDMAGLTTDARGVFRAVGLNSAQIWDRVVRQMEIAIVRWSLPLPVDRSGFEHEDFEAELGDWLLARIRVHFDSQRRTPEQQGN